ncbi:MAG: ComF family protein, partial [Eubacterium sp.]|nr:ComF family protein [Eubacterium sp.]
MKRFKYSGRAEYAEYFARAILEAGEDEIRRHEPDCLVPVPVHRLRYRERGYNQAEELAKELSKLLGIPCRSRLLIRIRNTVPQNPLLPEERRENVKNAFSLREADIRKKSVPKRILLVDDICTTG